MKNRSRFLLLWSRSMKGGKRLYKGVSKQSKPVKHLCSMKLNFCQAKEFYYKKMKPVKLRTNKTGTEEKS